MSPLPGGDGTVHRSEQWRRLARTVGIPAALLAQNLSPYGSASPSVLADLPAEKLLTPSDRLLSMHLRYAVREEMALHLTDVLLRRTDFLRFSPHKTEERVAALGEEMAQLLGWSEPRRDAEIEAAMDAWRAMFAWRGGEPAQTRHGPST